jgi:polysaccharide export outer membrane protein
MSGRDRSRLETLTRDRAAVPGFGYRVGPDDLLEVRVPDLGDAAATAPLPLPANGGVLTVLTQAPVYQQGVRVNALGDVALPLIGTVRAAGLTPTELEGEVGRRLAGAGILRRPHVSVQVAEYRSRVVAVVGSVERPGVYPLTRPGATLADMVWAAGGPNKDAGRVVAFVPASGEGAPAGAAPDLERLVRGEPIRIDLDLLLHPAGGEGAALDPPARPGDLISVAPAGTVQVDGWVQRPGSYPVTRALTLSGAVAAAGGHLYPANLRRVTLRRVLGSGEQRQLTVDLARVAEGAAPDLPVADGDVIRLPPSYPRMVPYGLWGLVTALVHVGGSVALF